MTLSVEQIRTERCPVKCPKCYAYCIYKLGHIDQVTNQISGTVHLEYKELPKSLDLPDSEHYHAHWKHGRKGELSSKRPMHRWR